MNLEPLDLQAIFGIPNYEKISHIKLKVYHVDQNV